MRAWGPSCGGLDSESVAGEDWRWTYRGVSSRNTRGVFLTDDGEAGQSCSALICPSCRPRVFGQRFKRTHKATPPLPPLSLAGVWGEGRGRGWGGVLYNGGTFPHCRRRLVSACCCSANCSFCGVFFLHRLAVSTVGGRRVGGTRAPPPSTPSP